MIIISHRGYWKQESEKNTLVAFERSFINGFGVETDVRDYKGSLVVSHDLPDENSLPLELFFKLYKSFNNNVYLALNIKSDGLQKLLVKTILEFEVHNYFVFDMSVPDGLHYLKNKINVFTRQSEYETFPSYYQQSEGVWLDEFFNHWITPEVVTDHINSSKKVCIVSPELHGRIYCDEWKMYKEINTNENRDQLMLCTDYPDEANNYFNG